MTFLTTTEKDTLRAQIQQAENGTTGEIVTVIARQSDGYRYIPLLWASLISLSIPGFYFLFQYFAQSGWSYPGDSAWSLARVYQIQVLVFLGLGTLLQISNLRLWFVPKSVKFERAKRHAHEQFFLQNLHLTANNTGVLIFVSVAEHYVEIIVDKGIGDVVDNTEWRKTVDEFIMHIRSGDIATGFATTVEQCSEILHTHFPAEHGRPDELPNHLIEV